MRKILSYAFMNAFFTGLYVVLVVLFMNFLGETMGEGGPTIIAPISMLMLLVFSVALVGSLIFGRPVVWFFDDKKKEAIKLLIFTLIIFFMIMILVFLLFIGFVV